MGVFETSGGDGGLEAAVSRSLDELSVKLQQLEVSRLRVLGQTDTI